MGTQLNNPTPSRLLQGGPPGSGAERSGGRGQMVLCVKKDRVPKKILVLRGPSHYYLGPLSLSLNL